MECGTGQNKRIIAREHIRKLPQSDVFQNVVLAEYGADQLRNEMISDSSSEESESSSENALAGRNDNGQMHSYGKTGAPKTDEGSGICAPEEDVNMLNTFL